MEEWEWGPGFLLDAGQTPGKGASLTSSACLLSAIKTQIIGAVATGEPRSNKRTSLEGDKEAGLLPLAKRDTWSRNTHPDDR